MKLPKFLTAITNSPKHMVREKAIERAKVRIALSNRNITELSEEEKEVIVCEEEDKLIGQLKGLSIGALMVFLGVH